MTVIVFRLVYFRLEMKQRGLLPVCFLLHRQRCLPVVVPPPVLDCLGPMVLRQAYSQLVHWLELAKILLVYFRLALKGQIQVGERSLLVKAHWHFLHIRRHLPLVLILMAFGRGLAMAIRPGPEQMELAMDWPTLMLGRLVPRLMAFRPVCFLLHRRHWLLVEGPPPVPDYWLAPVLMDLAMVEGPPLGLERLGQGQMAFLPVCFLREMKLRAIQLVYFLHRMRDSLLVEVPPLVPDYWLVPGPMDLAMVEGPQLERLEQGQIAFLPVCFLSEMKLQAIQQACFLLHTLHWLPVEEPQLVPVMMFRLAYFLLEMKQRGLLPACFLLRTQHCLPVVEPPPVLDC